MSSCKHFTRYMDNHGEVLITGSKMGGAMYWYTMETPPDSKNATVL